MAPRTFTNPAPVTDAAREALQSFYCDLCNKGYTRISELENHEKSYDHLHKKRHKEMKAMSKDPAAAEKARKAEERANKEAGLVNMKPIKIEMKVAGTATGKPGFKKGGGGFGFKKIGASDGGSDAAGERQPKPGFSSVMAAGDMPEVKLGSTISSSEPVTAPLEDELYDPFKPTGCRNDCPCRGHLATVLGDA